MRSLVVALAIALALTPVCILVDPAWAVPTGGVAIGGVILVGAVVRRLAPNGGVSALVQLMAIVVVALAVEPVLGIDTGRTWNPHTWVDAHASIVREASDQLASSVPPVPWSAELALVLGLVFALLTLLIDIVTVDLKQRALPACALAALGLATAVHVGSDVPAIACGGPIAGAALVLALDALAPSAIAGQPSEGGRRRFRMAAARLWRRLGAAGVVATAVGFAVVAAPLLAPGLRFGIQPVAPVTLAELQRSYGSGSLGSSMVDDSVSMRRTLSEADERTVLTYRSVTGEPTYLRTRVLSRFDGSTFKAATGDELAAAYAAPASPTDANLARTDLGPTDDEGNPAPLTITISDLTTDRVPVPEGLRAFGGPGEFDPTSEPPSFSEVAVIGGPTRLEGQTYYASSGTGAVDAASLADVSAADVATGEPAVAGGEVPQRLQSLADELRADASARTPFETALAYQNYFHGFTYSLTATTAPGDDPVDSFLDERSGYCEQFAASFAMMMNAQGFPTRVVVGFTGGTPTADDAFTVSNRDAHAWPEVWFGQNHGWVRFEPTPPSAGNAIRAPQGLGNDTGEAAGEGAGESAEPQESALATASSAAAEEPTAPAGSNPSPERENGASVPPAGETETRGGRGAPSEALAWILALTGAVAAVAALGAAARIAGRTMRARDQFARNRESARDARRWSIAHGTAHQTGDLSESALTAYHDIVRTAAEAGATTRPADGPDATLENLAGFPGLTERDRRDLAAISEAVMRGLYAPPTPGGPAQSQLYDEALAESRDLNARSRRIARALRNV